MVTDLVVEQFELVLAFELGLQDLDADDGGHALAGVVAAEVGVVVLEDALLARVVVDLAGKRGAQAGQMCAAIGRVDGVGKGEDRFVVAVGVLDCGLDVGRFDLHVDVDRLVQDRTILVEIAHKRLHATLEIEVDLACLVAAFIDEMDIDAACEEGHLAESCHQRVPVVFEYVENCVVAQKTLDRAGLVAGTVPDLLQVGHRHAAPELLLPDLAVALYLRHHPLAERVDRADADTVEAAGDLVAGTAELSAGVQFRHHDGQRGQTGLLLRADGNAGTVVFDGYTLVLVDRHHDLVAAALHRLIDGVVDDLVDHVMQRLVVGAADVHAGPLANSLQAFEHLDLIGAVDEILLVHPFSHRILQQFEAAEIAADSPARMSPLAPA